MNRDFAGNRSQGADVGGATNAEPVTDPKLYQITVEPYVGFERPPARESVMNNASIFTADFRTHLKIVVTSLVASIVVVVVGISAHHVPEEAVRVQTPVKVGPAMIATSQSPTEIR
jgi:hypothetical protein